LLSGNIQTTNSALETTFEDLKQLPVSEKIQLVEDLWDSIAAEISPVGLCPQYNAELDRRLDALEENPGQGTPWSAVREKILAPHQTTRARDNFNSPLATMCKTLAARVW
jgi:putative addiction module component (TIGR02574 family)